MPFDINGEKIHPGEQKRIIVNIAMLPSHSSIDISVTVSRSREPGPVLLMLGGLHGDEINGVEIVRRMIEQDMIFPQKGTTICVPILNIYGFIHFSRYVPDGKDVNRSFPGNKNGSLAARVAHYMMHDIIPKIDYGIDFHTGGADRSNYPQIRCSFRHEETLPLAEAFGAPFTLNSPYRPRSLRQSAARLGKPMLVYEGGESSRFDEMAIEEGIRGAERLMAHLGMIPPPKKALTHGNQILQRSSWVRAKHSGIFRRKIANGAPVNRNQVLGTINDPFGDFKVAIKSPVSGFIIGINNDPLVHQGDAIIHIGLPS
ncbi:MAG: succinylglutamate desuccinylase/aspartoacylase family protein [Cyclobacteriaceae bacterium]